MTRFIQVLEQLAATALPALCSWIGAVWIFIDSQSGEPTKWSLVLFFSSAIWLCLSQLLAVLRELGESTRLRDSESHHTFYF